MRKLFFLLLLLLFVNACSSEEISDTEPFFICTDEFRFISLNVTDNDGFPYALDSIKVFEGDIIIPSVFDGEEHFVQAQKTGKYAIVDDLSFGQMVLSRDEIRNANKNRTIPTITHKITVYGYKKDVIIFKKTLEINQNPCHIDCNYNPDELHVKITEY